MSGEGLAPGALPGSCAQGDTVGAAVSQLRAGALIVLPTETVYGLAADAGNAAAVAAIYALKGRPAGHPLIVHVSGIAAARWWGLLGEAGEKLATALWPGPLTLIVRRRPDVPAHACGGHATIGLRVPSHALAQQVLGAFEAAGGRGVAAPSANRFGRISPTRAEHVRADLGADAPLLLEGGASVVGIESTIVDVSGARTSVLRPGAIGVEAIEAVLGRALDPVQKAMGDRPAAPGTLAAHYAPLTPLELVARHALQARVDMLTNAGQSVAVYARSVASAQTAANPQWLAMPDDAQTLARHLYDDLRRLDAMRVDCIVVEDPAHDAALLAVRDRLLRAATGSGTGAARAR